MMGRNTLPFQTASPICRVAPCLEATVTNTRTIRICLLADHGRVDRDQLVDDNSRSWGYRRTFRGELTGPLVVDYRASRRLRRVDRVSKRRLPDLVLAMGPDGPMQTDTRALHAPA